MSHQITAKRSHERIKLNANVSSVHLHWVSTKATNELLMEAKRETREFYVLNKSAPYMRNWPGMKLLVKVSCRNLNRFCDNFDWTILHSPFLSIARLRYFLAVWRDNEREMREERHKIRLIVIYFKYVSISLAFFAYLCLDEMCGFCNKLRKEKKGKKLKQCDK